MMAQIRNTSVADCRRLWTKTNFR